jgi:hypothetical protein
MNIKHYLMTVEEAALGTIDLDKAETYRVPFRVVVGDGVIYRGQVSRVNGCLITEYNNEYVVVCYVKPV